MEKIDVIMQYDWEELIKGIVDGIINFFNKVKYYFPKAYHNYEKPEEYEF